MRRIAPAVLLCLIIPSLLNGCVAQPRNIAPLTAQGNGYQADRVEQSLIALSDQAHQDFARQGLLVNDSEMTAYINDIARKLVVLMKLPVQPRYYVLKDPSINAMAFPNGNIYINIGLIAKLQSEDQLALVIAHETAHFVERHSYKGQLSRQNSTVAAHVTDLLLFGTGLVYIPYALDILSFSREQEKEADLLGLSYLAGTDYNIDDAINVFVNLAEIKHKSGGSAWDNHPDIQAREIYSKKKVAELTRARSQQAPRTNTYEDFRRHIADLNIQTHLLNQQYELTVDNADQETIRQGESAKWYSYRGDALLGQAEHPDAAAREHAWLYKKNLNDALLQSFTDRQASNLLDANTAYQKAILLDSNFAPAYRGLGLAARTQGQTESATRNLQRYLELSPSAVDRRYIEGILRKLAPSKDRP